jgi:dihydrofolate reductase
MSELVVHMSLSLDGYVAAAGDGPGKGLGVGGEGLHAWLTEGNPDPGSHRPLRGVNAEVFDEMLATGAVVTGRHTFEWAGRWGDDHHGGVPIFVLSRTATDPGGPDNVHYTADLESAVARAKAAAGDRDVMMHGASSVRALLRLGLVDAFALTLVPILLGRGKRLFEDGPAARLRLVRSREGEGVLHLRYAVDRPA